MSEVHFYEHLGRFFGDHLPGDTLDAYVARTVKPDDWGVVADLYERKWYGYRFIAPGASLFLFADRYKKAYVQASKKFLGRKHVPKFLNDNSLHPSSKTPMSPADISGLWIAMCMADDMGVPYDVYCAAAIDICHTKGWTYLPRPTQIYGDRMLSDIAEVWAGKQADRIQRTADPHYSLKNFCDHKWQVDYQNYLLDMALKRPNINMALANVLFREPQVLPSLAAKRLGEDRVREIHRYAS